MFITWLAFLLRTINLDGQSLWRDEVDAIRFSSWAIRHLVDGLFQQGHNGPLYFMLLRPWRNLTGDSEFALRYPSALMGAVAIPLGFILARQLGFSRRAGLLLGFLLATSPYLVWYGQEAKMYTLLLAAVTLAFIAYLKALTRSKLRWWVVFVVSTSLSFYFHILSPLMLIVYTVVALVHRIELRRHWRAWLISMASLTLPYVPLALWQFSFFIAGTDRGHPFYPLRQELLILLQLYTRGLFNFAASIEAIFIAIGLDSGIIPPSADLAPLIFFVFLFLCGSYLMIHRAIIEEFSLSKGLVLIIWVLLPPLIVYLMSLRIPIFEDRYLIYISPAFYLIVVLGLILIRQYSTLFAGLALLLILTINLLGIWQQQRQPVKADFRAAAEYLASQPRPPSTIMVQMPYLHHTLNYYYPHDYRLINGLWTNSGNSEVSIAQEMTGLTADLSDMWLVVSEEDAWDSRHLVRTWLDEHAHLVDKANFVRVDVYHYQFRPGTIETQTSTR